LKNSGAQRWVYIDLGANNGDSVYNFFGVKLKYPSFLSKKDIDENDWIVYAFEANPLFNTQLDKMKTYLVKSRREINLFKSTAAWIYNGNITFFLDTVNEENNFWGSSLKSEMVFENNKKQVQVPCLDVADILEQYTKDDMIVMKVDIEGAEYDVLSHLIARNVLGLVDFLGVEYHTHGLDKSVEGEKKAINKLIQKLNVKLIEWI
jgi:FkbM family methyltransferase